MKKQLLIACIALLSFTAIPLLSQAQAAEKQATIKVSGEVSAPLTIDAAYLQKFTQTTVIRKDRDGKDHTYSGVIVSEILKNAGVTLGPELKGENLTKYLLVEASDGYQVIFALAELDKGYTDRAIILADQVDGKPLAPGDGPYRIIVQDEKKPARCIKQVTAMQIHFIK
ncbi:molybdopterin-dependent oxidoreductase [Mucilaginibacter sp. SP1R1]|uniref:molybdopterin-dependent oxidoreductase n=1 Tax=Mucilaginibacter sp. SP1R1 TaxID=2723091 RepID=UPI00160C6225|nr:molybdopterin-dependent oxidoreductase [Mucilaginibacter sp. SP1R1]MBB6147798.1 DMSO/TMAO reductase YedYZ molybdopterin-dependent catalytic subunit [Mucilaginibacter sp. SP1R1]